MDKYIYIPTYFKHVPAVPPQPTRGLQLQLTIASIIQLTYSVLIETCF